MTSVRDAAISYAARGWPVLPIRPRSKIPACKHGVHDATTDAGRINRWWRRHPDHGVGVATGVASGLLVLDVDQPELLIERHLPETVTQRTGRGWQYFYRWEGTGGTRTGILPGVDTRGDGAYVVAPPSIHPSGRRYAWAPAMAPNEIALASPPLWLVELLTMPNLDDRRPAADWIAIARDGATQGKRNHTLARLAGHLFRRRIDPRVTRELCLAWAQARCNPPMERAEAERTIESIALAELRRREGSG